MSNAYAGFGLPVEAPVTFEFPIEMFLEGSDLSPIAENFDELVASLTKWTPKVNKTGVYPAPPATVEGADYREAVENTNAFFLKNYWGDGLPVTPPTKELVDWIMTGTDLAPDAVVAKVLPRNGVATVQALAVNLAMAGGRPEYMPVLIAAVKAATDPKFELQSVSPSTNSNYITVIVNGPMAKDIRLNSGYSLVGPDSAHPAGQVIGRALALVLQNLGGAIPGIGAMELYGGMRITNAVFAEDEAGLPEGWEPFSTERGFKKGENAVTVMAASSAVNITIMQSDYKEDKAATEGYLQRIAGNMAAPNMNVWSKSSNHKTPDFAPGLVLIPRTFADRLASLGWDKVKTKEFLRENSQVSWDELKRIGLSTFAEVSAGAAEGKSSYLSETPDQIRIVVAGGAQAAHAYWMEIGKCTNITSSAIELPAKWSELIAGAEADLGPIPAN